MSARPTSPRPGRRPVRSTALALVALSLVVLLSSAPFPVSSSAQGPADASGEASQTVLEPGRQVIDDLSGDGGVVDGPSIAERTGSVEELPAGVAAVSVAVDGFVLCHEPDVPAAVVADIVQALAAWNAVLGLSGPPIGVDLRWVDLAGPSSLGVAGPVNFVSGPGLPRPLTRYPVALANHLLGADQNGPGCAGAGAEIVVSLNRSAGGDGSLWNIGDEQATTAQIDLSTVAMHEIGHGLGLVSSAGSGSGELRWPYDGGSPYRYDQHFGLCESESATGCDGALNPLDPANGTAGLTSTRLWFDAAGGHRLELHAPSAWAAGSSVAHLDETRYPASSPFGLMTPFFRRGEVVQTVDAASQSVLQTLGWTLARPPVPPSQVVATRGDASVSVSFAAAPLTAADGAAVAAPATTHRITVRRGGAVAATVDTLGSPVTVRGLTNGVRYAVDVRAVNSAGPSGPPASVPEVVPLELPPFATAESAIETLSRGLLGLAPDRRDLADGAARLRTGTSIPAEASRLAASNRMERRLQVIRLYLGFFERDPDPGGLAYWFAEVERGVTLDVIASSFAIASEFDRGRTVPTPEFVDAAYRRILGRAPDADGRNYWETTLGRGLDRGQMLILFTQSAEHVAKTAVRADVISVSFGLLGRIPVDAEATAFGDVAAAGGRAALAAQLAAGPEFFDRFDPD